MRFIFTLAALFSIHSAMADEYAQYSPAPFAFHDWCKSDPVVCDASQGSSSIQLTYEMLSMIEIVNHDVNAHIKPADDIEQYGIEDHWVANPQSGFGDCEDYALSKKALLLNVGLPSAAMRLATVYDPETLEGHAVLVIGTSQGLLVLDNRVPEVLELHKAMYKAYWIQPKNPNNMWTAVVP